MSVLEAEAFVEALETFSPQLIGPRLGPVTTLQTDVPAGFSSIALPEAGELWVYFSYQGEAEAKAWLWDQKTLFTPIKPNEQHVLTVRKGDRLVYKLASATQQITLSWGYEVPPRPLPES